MVQPKYNPQEALKRVELMMKYDSSKTLTENKEIIFEQSDFNYFNEISKSIMKYPDKWPIDFGKPTIDVTKHSQEIYKAIKGAGRDSKGLEYIIPKTFNTINNSVSTIKTYPSIGKESIYDAINGEWFAGKILSDIISRLSTQLTEWCNIPNNKKNDICTIKTKEQLKYGI